MKLRIGTRGSRLARVQSRDVGRALEASGHTIEYVVIQTSGDASADRPYAEIGPPGIFVRAIEEALLRSEIDIAVHSYKDLPSESASSLVVAAVPERADPRDVLVVRDASRRGNGVVPLGAGAIVGTASARREAILAELRPDLRIRLMRGNVTTRLNRLRKGPYDATVLAAAGLDRLLEAERERDGDRDLEPFRLAGLSCVPLDPELFVPAPAQGAIAVQVRADDREIRRESGRLDDAETRRTVEVERSLLARVGGSCTLPFGAWCRSLGGVALELHAVLGTGGELRRARTRGSEPIQLAREAWQALGAGARGE